MLSRGLFNLLRLQSAKPTSGLESILKNIHAQKTQLGKSNTNYIKKLKENFYLKVRD